ncbi:hypothetical protein HDU81_004623 [Chytriomyces hyalinus]|nr:hypothetical protein HDU81_004623 [Chytriomyces hyalinus]
MPLATPPTDAGNLPPDDAKALLRATKEEANAWIEGMSKEILPLLANEPALEEEMRLIETGAVFSTFPSGHHMYKTMRPTGASDKYLYGHPSGRRFRSKKVCQCRCCSKKPGKPSSASSGPSSGSSSKAPLRSVEMMRSLMRKKKLQAKEAANDGSIKLSAASVSPSMASKSSDEVAPSLVGPADAAIEIKSDKEVAATTAALEKADLQNVTEMESDQEDEIPLAQIFRSKSSESLPREISVRQPSTEREMELEQKEAAPAIPPIKNESVVDLPQISGPLPEPTSAAKSIADEARESLPSSAEAPHVTPSPSPKVASPQVKKYSVNLKHMNIVRQSTEGKDAWSEHMATITSKSNTAAVPSAASASINQLQAPSESKGVSSDQFSATESATLRQKKRLMKEQEDARKTAEERNPSFAATHSENFGVPVIDSGPEKMVSIAQTGGLTMPSRNDSIDSGGSTSLPARRNDDNAGETNVMDREIEQVKRPNESPGGHRKKVRTLNDYTPTTSSAFLAPATMKESQAWSAPIQGESKHSERSLFPETPSADSTSGPTFLPVPSHPSSPLGRPTFMGLSSKEQANLILSLGSSVSRMAIEPIPPNESRLDEQNDQTGFESDIQDTGIQNSYFLETFQTNISESAKTSNHTIPEIEAINPVPEKPRMPEIQEDFARNALNVLKGILNSDYATVPTRMIEAAVLNSVAHAQHTFSEGQMVWTPAVICPTSKNFNLVANVTPANGPPKSIELDMKPFVNKSVSWPAIVKSVRHNVQELVDTDPACRIWEDPIVVDDLGDDMLSLSQFEDTNYGPVQACQSGNIVYEIELLEFPDFPIFMEGRFLKNADEIHVPGQYVLGLDGLEWDEAVEFKHRDGTGNVSLVYELYVKSLNEAKANQFD